MPAPVFPGLRTVIDKVGDLAAVKAWYRKATGVDPYFDEPFYVGPFDNVVGIIENLNDRL